MEYDSHLKNVKDKMNGVNGSSFDSFVSSADTAFTDINAALGRLNSLSSVWQDAVQESYQEMIPQVQSVIDSCSQFPTNVITPAAGKIDGLISKIEEYMKAVDSYNSIEEDYNSIEVGYEPQRSSYDSDDDYDDAHKKWEDRGKQKDECYENLVKTVEEINKYTEESYAIFNDINGILGGAGMPVPAAAVVPTITTSSKGKDTLENGLTKEYERTFDKYGTLIKEEYIIKDSSGNIVEKGTIYYHETGYSKLYRNGTKVGDEEVEFVEFYSKDDRLMLKKTSIMEKDGDIYRGVTDYYDKDGYHVSQTNIDSIDYADGKKESNVQLIMGKDNQVKIKKVETVEYIDKETNEKIVQEKVEINYETKITKYDKVEYSDLDGNVKKIEKTVEINYDTNIEKCQETLYFNEKRELTLLEKNSTINHNENTKDIVERVYINGCIEETIHIDNNNNTIEIQERFYDDGTVERKITTDLNTNIDTIVEREYSDGSLEKGITINHNNDTYRIEEAIPRKLTDEELSNTLDSLERGETLEVNSDGESYTIMKDTDDTYLVLDKNGDLVDYKVSKDQIQQDYYARIDNGRTKTVIKGEEDLIEIIKDKNGTVESIVEHDSDGTVTEYQAKREGVYRNDDKEYFWDDENNKMVLNDKYLGSVDYEDGTEISYYETDDGKVAVVENGFQTRTISKEEFEEELSAQQRELEELDQHDEDAKTATTEPTKKPPKDAEIQIQQEKEKMVEEINEIYDNLPAVTKDKQEAVIKAIQEKLGVSEEEAKAVYNNWVNDSNCSAKDLNAVETTTQTPSDGTKIDTLPRNDDTETTSKGTTTTIPNETEQPSTTSENNPGQTVVSYEDKDNEELSIVDVMETRYDESSSNNTANETITLGDNNVGESLQAGVSKIAEAKFPETAYDNSKNNVTAPEVYNNQDPRNLGGTIPSSTTSENNPGQTVVPYEDKDNEELSIVDVMEPRYDASFKTTTNGEKAVVVYDEKGNSTEYVRSGIGGVYKSGGKEYTWDSEKNRMIPVKSDVEPTKKIPVTPKEVETSSAINTNTDSRFKTAVTQEEAMKLEQERASQAKISTTTTNIPTAKETTAVIKEQIESGKDVTTIVEASPTIAPDYADNTVSQESTVSVQETPTPPVQDVPTVTPPVEENIIEKKPETPVAPSKDLEASRITQTTTASPVKSQNVVVQTNQNSVVYTLNDKYNSFLPMETNKEEQMLQFIQKEYGIPEENAKMMYNNWLSNSDCSAKDLTQVETLNQVTMKQMPSNSSTTATPTSNATATPADLGYKEVFGSDDFTSFNGKIVKTRMYEAPDGRFVRLPIE